MQCLQLTLIFTVILAICYVSGRSESDESFERVHLSRKKACSFLQKQLKRAEKEVTKDEDFREYLISRNLSITSGEPAFLFLNQIPLRDDLIPIYHDSSVVFEVSQSYAKRLFRNKLPRSRNINPLLRKNSSCLREYFEQFCIDNKHYECDKTQTYRTIDGYCTSLYRPKEGAASTPFTSFLYQNYDDSISEFREEARSDDRLPLVRKLSNIFFDRCKNYDVFLANGPTISGTQFGVFITIDVISLAYPRSSPTVTCCKKDYSTILPKKLLHKSCNPIRIPKDDSFFGPRNMTCMNFARTQNGYDTDCVLSSRKQLNVGSSALDLSQIYGSTKHIADSVRSFVDGLLLTNPNNLFPEDANGNFILNEFRFAASPITIIFGVLYRREHNRIARALKIKFPTWNDEKIFQEARRWNIALYQYVVFEWIKIFIPDQYKRLRITKNKNTKVTCTSSNEFGHAIFRLHHRFISETVQYFDANGNMVQELPLNKADPVAAMRNSYSNVARSLFYQKQNYNGCHNQIRNQLFSNSAGVGMDVLSFDIKRGRDHGIQPYYRYVEVCLNKKVKSFSDLKFLFSDKNIKLLREAYESVHDIDLYIGAHLEKRPQEFQFGAIGSCITNEQFYRYQHGDSFFYDNPIQNYPFTDAQIAEIRKASFSRLLCDNGDITRVPRNAFMAISSTNPLVDCGSVPSVNLVY